MNTIYVREWMTTNPIATTSATTLPAAYQTMAAAGIRHLPVLSGDQVVGLVTIDEIRRAELETAVLYKGSEIESLVAQSKTVVEIMSDRSPTVTPNSTVATAARLMLAKKLTGLPVIENGKLVGIITASDIFRLVTQMPLPDR